jgi:20S proteasome alpha/beta subunit
MSLVIALYVREGIVMASDSRLTLNSTTQLAPTLVQQQGQETQPNPSDQQQDYQSQPIQQALQPIVQQMLQQVAVGQSDSTYKTFLTSKHVGISTFGAADIQGVPFTGYIESFINEELPQSYGVDDVPSKLLNYFKALPGPPNVSFFVAGYKTQTDSRREPYVYRVDLAQDGIHRENAGGVQGAAWGGEIDTLTRLIQPLGSMDDQGNFNQVPYYEIPWGFFTLQDAIDYALYAIRTTIDSIRFQPRAKTVGGSIDVLVIKPDIAFWVQKKELRGQ